MILPPAFELLANDAIYVNVGSWVKDEAQKEIS